MTTKRVHVLVSGRVQGVFFRASTRAEAVRLAVAGWVKNLEDGGVEFVAEGETGAVDALVLWARRGPDGARVDDARVEVQAYGGELRGFEVLR